MAPNIGVTRLEITLGQYLIDTRVHISCEDLWDTEDLCWDADEFNIIIDYAWRAVPPDEYETYLSHGVCAFSYDTDAVLCIHGDQELPDGTAIGVDVIGRNAQHEWVDYASGLLMFCYGEGDGHGLPWGCASTRVPYTGWMQADDVMTAYKMRTHYRMSEGDNFLITTRLGVEAR
jgi:hypothetical protein